MVNRVTTTFDNLILDPFQGFDMSYSDKVMGLAQKTLLQGGQGQFAQRAVIPVELAHPHTVAEQTNVLRGTSEGSALRKHPLMVLNGMSQPNLQIDSSEPAKAKTEAANDMKLRNRPVLRPGYENFQRQNRATVKMTPESSSHTEAKPRNVHTNTPRLVMV